MGDREGKKDGQKVRNGPKQHRLAPLFFFVLCVLFVCFFVVDVH